MLRQYLAIKFITFLLYTVTFNLNYSLILGTIYVSMQFAGYNITCNSGSSQNKVYNVLFELF